MREFSSRYCAALVIWFGLFLLQKKRGNPFEIDSMSSNRAGIWSTHRRPPIETVIPEGTFCDTVQVLIGAGDMQLI